MQNSKIQNNSYTHTKKTNKHIQTYIHIVQSTNTQTNTQTTHTHIKFLVYTLLTNMYKYTNILCILCVFMHFLKFVHTFVHISVQSYGRVYNIPLLLLLLTILSSTECLPSLEFGIKEKDAHQAFQICTQESLPTKPTIQPHATE